MLFFVRNHGHVPRVLDCEVLDWQLSIEGYVSVKKAVQTVLTSARMVQNCLTVTVQQLMDEANAEYGLARRDQRAQDRHGIDAGCRRVAGPVRQKDAIRAMPKDVLRWPQPAPR